MHLMSDSFQFTTFLSISQLSGNIIFVHNVGLKKTLSQFEKSSSPIWNISLPDLKNLFPRFEKSPSSIWKISHPNFDQRYWRNSPLFSSSSVLHPDYTWDYIIINHIIRIIPAVLVEVGSKHQLEIAHTDCTLVVQYCYINNIAFLIILSPYIHTSHQYRCQCCAKRLCFTVTGFIFRL